MGITETVHYYLYEAVDKRAMHLPLVSSNVTVPMILVLYLYVIVYLGPKFMKNRQPWSLKTFIRVYNVFQIISNAILVYKFYKVGWFHEIWFYCIPPTYDTDPKSMEIINTLWWTLILKIIDLIETGVYVLRKKNNQLSFLHLYHHISTVLIGWFFLKYVAVEMAITVPIINCGVHVIMYTYYLLASFGPEIQKKILPYKPLLTIVQMVQFLILMCHIAVTVMPSCDVPKLPGPVMFVNLLINFLLFYNFYRKAYLKPKEKKK